MTDNDEVDMAALSAHDLLAAWLLAVLGDEPRWELALELSTSELQHDFIKGWVFSEFGVHAPRVMATQSGALRRDVRPGHDLWPSFSTFWLDRLRADMGEWDGLDLGDSPTPMSLGVEQVRFRRVTPEGIVYWAFLVRYDVAGPRVASLDGERLPDVGHFLTHGQPSV